ncbi:MAG: hypothetical protein ACFB0C_05825 [Leptolyngbyaceae cyanobacterium]
MQQWNQVTGWLGCFALIVAMVSITPGLTRTAFELSANSDDATLISRGRYRNRIYRGTGRREVVSDSGRGSGRLGAALQA